MTVFWAVYCALALFTAGRLFNAWMSKSNPHRLATALIFILAASLWPFAWGLADNLVGVSGMIDIRGKAAKGGRP